MYHYSLFPNQVSNKGLILKYEINPHDLIAKYPHNFLKMNNLGYSFVRLN